MNFGLISATYHFCYNKCQSRLRTATRQCPLVQNDWCSYTARRQNLSYIYMTRLHVEKAFMNEDNRVCQIIAILKKKEKTKILKNELIVVAHALRYILVYTRTVWGQSSGGTFPFRYHNSHKASNSNKSVNVSNNVLHRIFMTNREVKKKIPQNIEIFFLFFFKTIHKLIK